MSNTKKPNEMDKISWEIDNGGFDSFFNVYKGHVGVKNKEFNRLTKIYLKARQELVNYTKFDRENNRYKPPKSNLGYSSIPEDREMGCGGYSGEYEGGY